MSQWGHRLGTVQKVGRENTIKRLRANWRYQDNPKFKYFEFDVVQCMDELIVYHDRDFKKLGDKRKVKDVSFKEIEWKYPFIPTLKEVLNELELSRKPVMVEIKRLNKEWARIQLLNSINEFKANSNAEINCLAFKSHFKKSFPKDTRKFWSDKFTASGIVCHNVRNHSKNLFEEVGCSLWPW